MSLIATCRKIRLILSDVDGVMTDGTVLLDDEGRHTMRFHIHDGMGVQLWQTLGYRFGIVSGRQTDALRRRASELGINILRLGTLEKKEAVDAIASELGIDHEAICYVGDDLPDLPAIRAVGLGVAVANGVEEVRTAADYITSVPGGNGAVREVVELILRNTGQWDQVMEKYAL